MPCLFDELGVYIVLWNREIVLSALGLGSCEVRWKAIERDGSSSATLSVSIVAN
jgi:hypothetical protein